MRVLQFTDLHLRGDPEAETRGVKPQRSFEAVVAHAKAHHFPADAILLTGDLADDEHASYPRLADAMRELDAPLMVLPGNHDDPAALRAAFPQASAVLDLGSWRIIGVDSQAAGAVHGEINARQWEMLENAVLNASGRHLLVALHPPPLPLGSEWMDRIGLRDAEAFRQWLTLHGVRACLFGHAHQTWDGEVNGVRYLCAPSTSSQFVAGSATYAISDEAPGYRWLELHDDGRIDTGVERVAR